MNILLNWFWPIVVWFFFGATIDFYIGRTGQARVLDFLETWWIRVSDIKIGNLGKEDALFIASVIDRWMGRAAWSKKRIKSCIAFAIFSVALGAILFWSFTEYDVMIKRLIVLIVLIPTLWLDIIGLCLSVSFFTYTNGKNCQIFNWRSCSQLYDIFILFSVVLYIDRSLANCYDSYQRVLNFNCCRLSS
jgi:hypothetical protein